MTHSPTHNYYYYATTPYYASHTHSALMMTHTSNRYAEKRVLEQHIARLNEEISQRDSLDTEMEVCLCGMFEQLKIREEVNRYINRLSTTFKCGRCFYLCGRVCTMRGTMRLCRLSRGYLVNQMYAKLLCLVVARSAGRSPHGFKPRESQWIEVRVEDLRRAKYRLISRCHARPPMSPRGLAGRNEVSLI